MCSVEINNIGWDNSITVIVELLLQGVQWSAVGAAAIVELLLQGVQWSAPILTIP